MHGPGVGIFFPGEASFLFQVIKRRLGPLSSEVLQHLTLDVVRMLELEAETLKLHSPP